MKKGVRSLTEAMLETPPAPCGVGESTCVFSQRCKAEKLACKRYAYYVEHEPPRQESRKGDWRRMVYRSMTNDDQPTGAVYDSIFDGVEKAPIGRTPKLTPVEVDAIRYQLSRGVTQQTLADEFLVSTKIIWQIKSGNRAAA